MTWCNFSCGAIGTVFIEFTLTAPGDQDWAKSNGNKINVYALTEAPNVVRARRKLAYRAITIHPNRVHVEHISTILLC